MEDALTTQPYMASPYYVLNLFNIWKNNLNLNINILIKYRIIKK